MALKPCYTNDVLVVAWNPWNIPPSPHTNLGSSTVQRSIWRLKWSETTQLQPSRESTRWQMLNRQGPPRWGILKIADDRLCATYFCSHYVFFIDYVLHHFLSMKYTEVSTLIGSGVCCLNKHSCRFSHAFKVKLALVLIDMTAICVDYFRLYKLYDTMT